MVDQHLFIKGFLDYLRQYYGLTQEGQSYMTSIVNNIKVPLFQQRELEEARMEQMQAMMQPPEEMPMMGMGGMGPMSPDMMALRPDELNGMFPGPYSRGM